MTDNGVRHGCHAKRCRSTCPKEWLMCARHWAKVPKHLQRAVWDAYRPGQCDDKEPSRAWINAADAAIEAVAEAEGIADRQRVRSEPMDGEAVEEDPAPLRLEPQVQELYSEKFWRIARRLVRGYEAEIAENPYAIVYRALPTVEIRPAWFDRLVRQECLIASDDPRRLEFLVWVAADESRRAGHTIIPSRSILDALCATADVPFDAAVAVMKGMVERDLLRAHRDDGRSFVALRAIDQCEEDAARFFAERWPTEKTSQAAENERAV